MSFKTLFVVTSILASIALANALTCYSCSGAPGSDCALGKNTAMVVEDCNKTSTATDSATGDDDKSDKNVIVQQVCMSFYDKDFTPKLYVRGCGWIEEESSDACQFLQKYVPIESCKACKADLCNAGAQA